MNWESVVAYIQVQGGNLGSISFQPIALNNVGDGQPDIHNEYANIQFLDTHGLPSLGKDARAAYILPRLQAILPASVAMHQNDFRSPMLGAWLSRFHGELMLRQSRLWGNPSLQRDVERAWAE